MAAPKARKAVEAERDERAPVAVPKVKSPTKEEIERHMITHMPYRSWCKACVAGRGRSRYHREQEEDRSTETKVVSMDYAFLGPRDRAT